MRTKIVDLHTHSNFSDGTLSPKELVLLAKERKITALALTDHDTTDGLLKFHEEGQKLGIETISGIEFAALHPLNIPTEIHIVGLFIDEKSKEFSKNIIEIKSSREERNIEMIKKLVALNMPITMDELQNDAKGEIITRAHYANIMLKKGYINTKNEAFQKYISIGLPAYVERHFLSPKKCIDLIHEAGGVSILAHPTLYKLNLIEIKYLAKTLKTYGLDGIEVLYPSYTYEQECAMKRLAEKLELLKSGGSDFHGNNKPDIFLGCGKGNLSIPYSYLENLKQKSARVK